MSEAFKKLFFSITFNSCLFLFLIIGIQNSSSESKVKLFKNETSEKFSISKIWNKLIDTKDLHGYESKQNFYHLTNLEIFKKLKDL